MLFGYVTIVMVWYLLGAIINPSAYLPYAAAACTFVTFCTAKFRQFKRLQTVGFEGIKRIMLKRLKVIME